MLLRLKGLVAGYASNEVVRGISLEVGPGEIVALLGHNGAGKTTTLKALFGLLKPSGGEVSFEGLNITGREPSLNVSGGLSYLPQGGALFPTLTVADNLELSSYTINDRRQVQDRLEELYMLFPVLKERSWQAAGTLSGGERRMLSLGMALMTRPRLLLLDEPSLGLAPLLVEHLMQTVRDINQRQGTGVLLVEQNVKQALSLAQRAYIMKTGRIILEDSCQNLMKEDALWQFF
jgi:branched-chain amino acid transport system ATP-binding protein